MEVIAKHKLHFAHCIVMLVSLLLCQHDVEAFGFTTPKSFIRGQTGLVLYGWFDFKPFHGSGSGDSKAFQEEQWQLQQDILRERAQKGLSKDQLKKKYMQKNAQTTPDPKSALMTEKGSAPSPPNDKMK